MNKENEYKWQIGELCKAVYDNIGEGTIYRIIGVEDGKWGMQLKIEPVFGCFANIERRRERCLGVNLCTPLSLVDLGDEYVRLGSFIAEEAKKRGT